MVLLAAPPASLRVMREPPKPPLPIREPSKPPLSARLKLLLEQYGPVALVTYFVIFALVLGGFAIAIHMGVHVQSAKGTLGTLGAAYVATKLTQPLRIAATLALTPLVAKLFLRKRPDSSS
jgi:hypothetical protein